MPVYLRAAGYKVYFWSNEQGEPSFKNAASQESSDSENDAFVRASGHVNKTVCWQTVIEISRAICAADFKHPFSCDERCARQERHENLGAVERLVQSGAQQGAHPGARPLAHFLRDAELFLGFHKLLENLSRRRRTVLRIIDARGIALYKV